MAPILSFTAEEAWRVLRPNEITVFTQVWKGSLPLLANEPELIAKWQKILAVRAAVMKELELARQESKIGSSLQAEVAIEAPAAEYEALASLGDDLRFVTITSAASVSRGDALKIVVTPSASPKCERCWHWRADVGSDPAHPTLCGRCVANLFGSGEVRRHA
jgi:isoleucyl-tRNA synthetase